MTQSQEAVQTMIKLRRDSLRAAPPHSRDPSPFSLQERGTKVNQGSQKLDRRLRCKFAKRGALTGFAPLFQSVAGWCRRRRQLVFFRRNHPKGKGPLHLQRPLIPRDAAEASLTPIFTRHVMLAAG